MSEASEAIVQKSKGRPRGSKSKNAADVIAEALASPEGKAALELHVNARMNELLTRVESAREQAGTAEDANVPDDLRVVRQLAAAIAEIADQGSETRKIRVAPEEAEARAQAREEMTEMIVQVRARNEYPAYELTRAVYLDEQLIQPTYVDSHHVRRAQRIEWQGVPDESMQPINEIAKVIYRTYMRSLGGATPDKRVEYTRAALNPGLRIIPPEGSVTREASPVPNPRHQPESGLRVLRDRVPGEIVETRVLGTVAHPARQVA